MSTARYRAWRFALPAFDSDRQPGLQLSATGGIAMVEEHTSIRQAILLLLSTRPRERVMRPTYGCDLQRVLFAPNDDTTAGLVMHYVRQAVQRWEPRVEILRVDAKRNDEDAARLDIVLDYKVKTSQAPGTMALSLNLEAGP